MSTLPSTVRPCRPMSGRGQLALFAGAYLLYSLSRHVAVGDLVTAQEHARWIVDLEASIAPRMEQAVQEALTGTAALWLLNHIYLAAQLIVLPGALVWLHRRRERLYVSLRNTVLATWVLALPVYAAFPTAPPRLADAGLVDTITTSTGLALDSKLTTSFYNELAAVPSLHCGFALAVALALAASARRRRTRALALAWAPAVALSVVATGNHWVFDIAAGFAVTGLGYLTGRAVQLRLDARNGRPRPRASSCEQVHA